jgi:hypothetical protein
MHRPKAERPPKLLRDEEVIAQHLTAALPPAQFALVDEMAARLRLRGGTEAHACVIGRHTRRRGSLPSAEDQTLPAQLRD